MLDLREHYCERLPSQIDALENARRGLAKDRHDSIDSIRRVAQRLAGSGAIYGFPEVSTQARNVERAALHELGAEVDRLIATLREATSVEAPAMGVLVVEDDPLDIRLLSDTIELAGLRIFRASTTIEAEETLRGEQIGLVILDLVLPDRDGRSFLLWMREEPRTASIPVFVISARCNHRIKAECLTLGAEQFFEKPVNLDGLRAAVSASMRPVLRSERDSRQDALTGLPNRAAFREAYARALALMSRGVGRLGVAILDLDHFERVNDEHGRAAGDRILRWTADFITSHIREADCIARWGGEAFVLLFPDTREGRATIALHEVLGRMSETPCVLGDGTEIRVTFSAGVCEADDGASLDDVLLEADRYLYRAKEAGRRQIVSSTTETAPTRKNVLLVEDDDGVADIVEQKLGLAEFKLLHCRSGAEALDAIERNDVAMVVLDVNLPGMDAYELLRKIRISPRFGDRPVVLLTGRGSEAEIVRGFDNGADDYMVKPFSPIELQARVHRLIRRA